MDDKEREELEDLRKIVAGIDWAFKKLTKKYLKDAPRGQLPLDSFLELVLLKARKMGRDKAFEHFMSEGVQHRMNEMFRTYTGENLRDMVFLPVLVKKIRKKEFSAYKKYRAHCLRGGIQKAVGGQTPEEAYENAREGIERHFSKSVATIGICTTQLLEEYDGARYLKEDVLAGFRVIVKVSEIEVGEEEPDETQIA